LFGSIFCAHTENDKCFGRLSMNIRTALYCLRHVVGVEDSETYFWNHLKEREDEKLGHFNARIVFEASEGKFDIKKCTTSSSLSLRYATFCLANIFEEKSLSKEKPSEALELISQILALEMSRHGEHPPIEELYARAVNAVVNLINMYN